MNTISEIKEKSTKQINQKKLLVIGAGILQLPAIKKAKEIGLYVAVADFNPNAIGVKYADEYFNVSTIDKEGMLQVAKNFKPQGIMTTATDMPMRTVAYVCNKIGLNSISEECAANCTDKIEMIRCFKNGGVPSPAFQILTEEKEIDKKLIKFTFPCIMKPADNSGSRGVVLCKDEEEVKNNYYYSQQSSRNGKVIIEEYMTGDEVSVEVFVIDGVANILQITDKLTTGAPHFVEMGHSQPTRLSKEAQNSIKYVAQLAVKSVGLKNGAAHLEMMVQDDKARMIEIGARMGGDCITSHLVPLSTGIDMVKQTILYSLNESVDINPKFSKGSAIRYIKSKTGTVVEIEGVDKAESVDGIANVEILLNKGDLIKDINSSTDRVGYVIGGGNSAEEAIKLCELAIEKIIIKVKII